MNYEWLDSIGYEFEGGWREDEQPSDKYGTMGDDGSINDDALYDQGANHTGEFNTFPVKLEEIKNVVFMCYPHYVHKSCGLHIHMSFTQPEYYARLCSGEFSELLRYESAEWAKKHFSLGSHQYARLAYGNDEYSSLVPPTLDQLCNGGGSRYKQINILSYCKHQTIEFRLHSAYNDPKLICEATHVILECIDVFFHLYKPKPVDIVKLELTNEVAATKKKINLDTKVVVDSVKPEIFIGEIK